MLAAVIDIGSNSVRLVLYQYTGHHAQAVFNEKSTCHLGAGLVDGDSLEPSAKDLARETITRFKRILVARAPQQVMVIATAAIRESQDGAAFAKELAAILDHPVHILSGKQEALYAAYGVQATIFQPSGLVMDMGGGSTELALINHAQSVVPLASIPYGSLKFADMFQHHPQTFVSRIAELLQERAGAIDAQHLYTVGGSFRAIARYHIKKHRYPLHIIHDYVMNADKLGEIIAEFRQFVQCKERIPYVARRRQHSVLPAAMMLKAVMRYCHAETVVFSSAGVREGALRELNPPVDAMAYDPLMAMVQMLNATHGHTDYILGLADWILSVVPCNQREARLVRAFCWISDIAATAHPDYRADYAFRHILATSGYGITHPEQVTLALMLYHRYRSRLKIQDDTLSLLSPRQRHLAYVTGQLAHMAFSLSAGSASLLSDYSLMRDATGGITLKVDGSAATTRLPDTTNWREGLDKAISALLN